MTVDRCKKHMSSATAPILAIHYLAKWNSLANSSSKAEKLCRRAAVRLVRGAVVRLATYTGARVAGINRLTSKATATTTNKFVSTFVHRINSVSLCNLGQIKVEIFKLHSLSSFLFLIPPTYQGGVYGNKRNSIISPVPVNLL